MPTITPCDDCIAGCCRETHLLPTGHDVYRIARALHLPPAEFTSLRGRDRAEGDFKIRLSSDAAIHHRLELRKIDESGGDWARRCVFLLTIGSRGRCGIYGSRPLVCRSYPYTADGDRIVVIRRRPYCPPGAWEGTPIDEPELAPLQQQRAAERRTYDRFVDDWNAAIATRGPATEADFLEHLLGAYAAL